MIVATRLCRSAYTAFDGSGGLYRSGRWHKRGSRVIYAAGSEALAALEVLVHLSSIMQVPEFVCVKAGIPEGLIYDVRNFGPLPGDWASADPIGARAFGSRWIREQLSPVLRIPSVVIPRESNFMINPAHPDIAGIEVGAPLPFEFDVRLFGRLQ